MATGDAIFILALVLVPTLLTAAMFISRNVMLGFPCVIFWAIFGADAYLRSVTPWADIYYYLFFASAFGMTSFCAFAAYGLRERKDTEAETAGEAEPSETDGGNVYNRIFRRKQAKRKAATSASAKNTNSESAPDNPWGIR